MHKLMKKLEKEFKNSDDYVKHNIELKDKSEIVISFIFSLVNDTLLSSGLIKSISELKELPKEGKLDSLKSTIAIGGGLMSKNLEEVKNKLLNGAAVVAVAGEDEVLLIPVQGWERRAISEPPTSAVLKGPREGFTEDINTNIGLIRRRIKSSDLVVNECTIGKYTSTRVCIMYIDSIAEEKVVKEVERRLSKINIDGLIDSFYIQSLLEMRKSAIFKQIGNTEKPDVATSRILEGRVAITMDGSPIVLTVPYMLLEDFQSADDYYMHSMRASFVRILRLVGLIISIILPGVYVALESFHYRLLPIEFLITLANSIQGIAFPPLLEILFVLFLFEILNEASIRMPKYLGMALSIIGALILGETAVQAGMISSPSVMIVALSGITLYTVPDQASPCSMLRLGFTIVGGIAGLYGLLIGFIFLTGYLFDMDSYGTPYMTPYAPTVKNDKKDAFIKAKMVNMNTRPEGMPNKNKVRMKNG